VRDQTAFFFEVKLPMPAVTEDEKAAVAISGAA
jgi:hypothetical protein